MSSGWEAYSIILLSSLFALVLPFVLGIAAVLIGRRPRQELQSTAPSSQDDATGESIDRINTRFFLGVNVGMVLIALSLVLIPIAGSFRKIADSNNEELMSKGLLAILSVVCVLALGLLYSARKGDLSWLRTYRPRKKL